MLKTYTMQTPAGGTIDQVANSSAEARRLVGIPGVVVTGWRPWGKKSQQCGGDCGDCNEARKCSAREQAL